MSAHTITTTARLVTLAVSDGNVINLPRRVDGLAVDSELAIKRALGYATPEELLAELKNQFAHARAVKLPVQDAVRGYIEWLAMAGEWDD